MPPPLFDAHNHLQDALLRPYLDVVSRDLAVTGITRAAVNGTAEDDWDLVAALAQEHPWVIPCFGLHPWRLTGRTSGWRDRLRGFVEKYGGGVGEIGLDQWMEGFQIEEQREVFTWQLRFAAERNLPATIHCLKAWGPLWEILRREPVPACGFLLHAYGGPLEMVEGFAGKGAYFSFSGSFLDVRKTSRRDVFCRIPADRLLVETDAPSMALPPEWRRWLLPDAPDGKTINHPANIVAVYAGLAELRGCGVEFLAGQVAENFTRLFGSSRHAPTG